MGKLIDEQDCCTPAQRRVEVEFLAHDAAVACGQRRQSLEPLKQAFRLDATVRLDISDDDISPSSTRRARSLEHGVSLADPRREAKEDAQPAPSRTFLFVDDVLQKLIRVGPHVYHACR